MPTETPCAKDDPMLLAWQEYAKTKQYANSFKWAEHEEHRQGSMWAAFLNGWMAAKGIPITDIPE